MDRKKINILMTGGGAPGAAGILKCLQAEKDFDILVADANNNVAGRYLNDKFEKIPEALSPSFIPSVKDICGKYKIDIILPLVTRELIPLATHKTEFEKHGTRILVSPVESLEIANNKSRLYEFLQWRGLEVPEFRVVETVQQFEEAVASLGYPAKPVCFKPSVSNGSRGFRIIDNSIDKSELLFNQKPTSVYITLEDAKRILASAAFPELLVSEWLPGEEYSVDCLAQQGRTVIVIPRLRSKTINGISAEGEIKKEDAIIEYSSRIIQELKLHGNIGVQVKRAANKKFLLLEVNPRVQGSISACLGAGINLPVLAIRQELGIPINSDELSVKWGTRFFRYWNELFY